MKNPKIAVLLSTIVFLAACSSESGTSNEQSDPIDRLVGTDTVSTVSCPYSGTPVAIPTREIAFAKEGTDSFSMYIEFEESLDSPTTMSLALSQIGAGASDNEQVFEGTMITKFQFDSPLENDVIVELKNDSSSDFDFSGTIQFNGLECTID